MSSLQIRMAQLALTAGDAERARSILIPLIQSNPRHGEAWYFLGQAMDDASRRKECFERAAALDYVPAAAQASSAPAFNLPWEAVSPSPAAAQVSSAPAFNLPWEAASPSPAAAQASSAPAFNLPWEAASPSPAAAQASSAAYGFSLPPASSQASAPSMPGSTPSTGYAPVTGAARQKKSPLKLILSIMVVLVALCVAGNALVWFQKSLASKNAGAGGVVTLSDPSHPNVTIVVGWIDETPSATTVTDSKKTKATVVADNSISPTSSSLAADPNTPNGTVVAGNVEPFPSATKVANVNSANLDGELHQVVSRNGLVIASIPNAWGTTAVMTAGSVFTSLWGDSDTNSQLFVVMRPANSASDTAAMLEQEIKTRYLWQFHDSALEPGLFSDVSSQNVDYTDDIPMRAALTTRIVGSYVIIIGVQVPRSDFETHTPRVIEVLDSVTIDPTLDARLPK